MINVSFERHRELEEDLKAVHKFLLELEVGKGLKLVGRGFDVETAKKIDELKLRMEVWLWQRA